MSLISRVEIHNYLTEGLESNHFANWNPMLTGITLRMDCKSSLVNITNGGGKTSMAELLLYLLSRDRTLLSHLRDKTAPKGRGYTHARIEFRSTDKNDYREPGLLEIDVDNMAGATHVIGVALNNDVADAPIFYSYSGTLENSPCYTKANGILQNVPDDQFVKRTGSMQSKWNKFANAREWQEHVGLFISMDVVRRNASYQAKGSDDKNASFFNFKPRNGESYDSAFFKAVIAPDLLTNLLNTFSEEDETGIEDTLHLSLSRIVNSERDIARKQANLARRESAIGTDLKPVVEAAAKANRAQEAMQTALRAVKKDVALLHHFGAQTSHHAVCGLPLPISSLVRSGDQDARIRKALTGMVIHRDDGILIVDKTLGDLAGMEVRRIGEIADRKHIPHSSMNLQVIDFACDFDQFKSGGKTGGHYRKGYTRASVEELLPLFVDTSGTTLEGLEDVFKAAFDIAQSQIDTNPASLKIHGLQATLAANAVTLQGLQQQSNELGHAIDSLEMQIKGKQDNEAAWQTFSAMANHLPEDLRSEPKQAKDWLSDEVRNIQQQLADMNKRQGALTEGWKYYLAAMEEAGLEGLDGIRTRYDELTELEKEIKTQGKQSQADLETVSKNLLEAERAVLMPSQKLALLEAALAQLEELKIAHTLFQSYFGDVDPLDVADPYQTAQQLERKKGKVEKSLESSKTEWNTLSGLKTDARRFIEIFGPDTDARTFDPVVLHREWSEKESLAQQNLLPLEPLVTALESFKVKFSGQSPAQWIEKTDIRREELEVHQREVVSSQKATKLEIAALDRLAVVDDAAFGRAWNLLGDGPQRLYALLQRMDDTQERRAGALSALTGLLSAPVFESLADLERAAELLEQHNIGIPLLLKEPLLQAIGAQGDLGGDLRVMGFFAGRYSRQARILLDPEFAKAQRAGLVSRLAELTLELNVLVKDLELVNFRNPLYVLATKALEAITLNCVSKQARYNEDLKAAQAALHQLTPQIQKEALACLRSRRDFLKKGGDERMTALWIESESLKAQVQGLTAEWSEAQKRATTESVQAWRDARKYVEKGADVAHGKAQVDRDKVAESLKNLILAVESRKGELELAKIHRNLASERERTFNDEEGPSRLGNMRRVLDFAGRVEDVEFMQGFKIEYDRMEGKSGRFIGFQSTVNFERASAYYENLGKTDADLVKAAGDKKTELATVQARLLELERANQTMRDAEIPAWVNLRKVIHDFAYEIGSLAAATRDAHAEFASLEEGAFPVEAHELFADIEGRARRMKSPTIDDTAALVLQIPEATFKIQSLDPKDALALFETHRSAYKAAMGDYAQKNKEFCEKSRHDAGTKLAAFNTLELDEIERSTPQHMTALVALFDRLSLSLEKDREDARKAIQTAQSANEEALNQLSSLIRVAEDNLDALKKVMSRYKNGCFKIKVQVAGEDLIKEILNELTDRIKIASANSGGGGKTLRRSDESRIKDMLRETMVDRIFLEPKVTFIHGGIRANESPVTDKLSTGQKVALEFMWIIRQAEYEIERGLRQLSSKQAEKQRQEINRVIFVDGIFSTLSDRRIIREAFSGLGNVGANFQIIGFLHSPTWTNDSSVFPVYHVGKKLTNGSGASLVAFSEEGRSAGTVGFFTSIVQAHESSV